MPASAGHDILSEHAIRIGGSGKPLSVLATPPEKRNETYALSNEARATLDKVLAEDLPGFKLNNT